MDFMHSSFIEDVTLADRIKIFFDENPENYWKFYGMAMDSNNPDTPTDGKKSTDMRIDDFNYPVIKELCDQIQIVLNEYIEIYPWCNRGSAFRLIPFNIQKYKPGEGFLDWHAENITFLPPALYRHLVFQMYCDDIEEGGGTEFHHQDTIIKSEKGKVIIFPATWMFAHRGIVADQEKTIATGWYEFYDYNDPTRDISGAWQRMEQFEGPMPEA